MSAALAALLAAVLAPVPPVSLDGLDPAVARQLGAVWARLAAAAPDAVAFGDAGRHYHAYEMYGAAEACYRNAATLGPEDFRWVYLLAVVQQEAGRLDEAADTLVRALSRPDVFYPGLLRLIALELARGRLPEAERWMKPARAHAATDPALLALEGELALAQGRAQDAAAALEEALRREPRASRLRYRLGMAYRALGRNEAARAELERAGPVGVRPLDPVLDAVHALRVGESSFMIEGHRAFRAGDFAAAAAAFTRAVEATGGTSAAALLNLATAEAQLGRRDVALARLAEARRVENGHPAVLFNLGVLLAEAGRTAEAEPVLAELVRRAPEDREARFEWILALVALGRSEEAGRALGPMPLAEAHCRRLRAALVRHAAAPASDLHLRARTCDAGAGAPAP